MTLGQAVVRRRFVHVDGRLVHYLRVGQGPPAVLVHSSPTNAWYVLPQMQQLASRFTCFAFDTPGFGLSQALPGEHLTVADLSQALAANMAAIGLPPCPVYGTHSGAAIALSLAARHPQQVTALALDGLPVFTVQEQAQIFPGYFEPLRLDDGGGHYARTWTRFRDQYMWFPWTQKRPEHHNEIDLGAPAALHDWLMSFFYAGRSYKPAYYAACHYGEQAITDALALRCPALFTATESDMLYPHLERLPPLQAEQEVRRIGNDKARKDALIGEVFERWPAAGPAPDERFELSPGAGIQQQFIDLDAHQVLMRHAGAAHLPTLVLLHDAPGSGRRPEALMLELATQYRVLAPDLPGCGGSDALPEGAPLAAWADVVAASVGAGGQPACIYGIGIGASVALVLAERHPALASSLVLRGLALPEPAERAQLLERYAPPIVPQADGSHWYRTWLMLRDQLVYFPWYDTRAAQLRRVPADFGADTLHEWTFEVMKQHTSYHRVIHAALAHDAAQSLAALRVPMAFCHDPQVPFFAYAARLRALCPGAATLPCEALAHAANLAQFIAAQPAAQSTPLPEIS